MIRWRRRKKPKLDLQMGWFSIWMKLKVGSNLIESLWAVLKDGGKQKPSQWADL